MRGCADSFCAGPVPQEPFSDLMSMQQYAQQIDRVRQMAISHVQRCGGDPAEMKDSFLFAGDRFAGVRFAAGGAEARWLFGNELVELVRSGSVVARVKIDGMSAVRRAA